MEGQNAGKRFICPIIGVWQLIEEIHLVREGWVESFGWDIVKQLIERCFFEECETENLQNCVERRRHVQALFDDGDEHVDGDCDPDLGFDGIFRGAEKRLDAQMLLGKVKGQKGPASLVSLSWNDCPDLSAINLSSSTALRWRQ